MAKRGKSPAKKRAESSRQRLLAVRETALLPGSGSDTAKLFWNGRSQAVRLPLAFRFEGDAVRIRREGDRVILEPLRAHGWPPGFFERLGGVDESFERAIAEFRREAGPMIRSWDDPEADVPA